MKCMEILVWRVRANEARQPVDQVTGLNSRVRAWLDTMFTTKPMVTAKGALPSDGKAILTTGSTGWTFT